MAMMEQDPDREERITMEIIVKTKEALEDWHYWVDQGYGF
jgi:hypothetical protein